MPQRIAFGGATAQVASLPTASAAYKGQLMMVRGNGTTTADVLFVCLMSATGTYSWKQIVSG
jgi:hypothetical protein